ncbi:hypothetical protein [Clostridium sp. HBUAS56010]|uniref:DUF7768 domain-containing protein n=1 Tax=Clostridium sp. HBUAS56010 TaxID=2571127 RepID=UPI001177F04A|nr:hypothetical protein [Clostridium sp. HBUAS56010]
MKLVMVVTKITGNEENDRARALEYCRFAAHKGVLPTSSYLNFHNIFMDELGFEVEHLLTLRLAKQVDEIWVFGNEKEEEKRSLIENACLEYGSRAKYFDAREIGEELLLCTMFSEKLIERLEELEEC